jgi:hypothetical protein
MSEGIRNLVEAFYRSITDDQPVPIPYREIVLTARIMDDIFAQLAAAKHQTQPSRHSVFS